MDVDNMIAVIKDNYNNTINNMPLNTNGSTLVNFAVSSNPASYALNRFSIVFSSSVVLPVTFNNIKAGRMQQEIAVDWTVSNEVNIKAYEIERSGDGNIFQKLGTKNVSAGGSTFVVYRYLDLLPLDGNNFYRVKSVNFNGSTTYSNVAKVEVKIIKTSPTVNIYPNPVTGNTVSLRMNYVAEGDYKVQVYAINGQLMQTFSLYHDGTSSLQKLSLRPDFPSGKYELKISGDGFIGSILLLKQ